MRPRRTITRSLLGFLALAGCVLAGAPHAAAVPAGNTVGESGSGTAFRHYVALGDSYTSGPLIPWQRLDPLGCFRSTNNYPSLLADRLGVRSTTDVSCGGADTTHMASPQDVPLGPNPPQFDALRANTDLVTLGIGGNDFGVFGNIVGTCPALRETDPTGAPCREHFTESGQDQLLAVMPWITDRVRGVLAGIERRSPNATVLVIGYPRIAPETGYCPDILPFADGDYAWANEIERALNAAIEEATTGFDARFVDTYPASEGHDACAPDGAAWINGQHIKPLAAANYHPYKTGMIGVANVIYRELTGMPAPTDADTVHVARPVASAAQLDALARTFRTPEARPAGR
ncbi:MAG: SGNH/GDSL hydrolase family protein [Pseudonocardiaceae bacterium]|nr:SGNH/GDSL hydrolase family protein [Pseudonocardiaceae bacterium]